jgi:hypothetical protein
MSEATVGVFRDLRHQFRLAERQHACSEPTLHLQAGQIPKHCLRDRMTFHGV